MDVLLCNCVVVWLYCCAVVLLCCCVLVLVMSYCCHRRLCNLLLVMLWCHCCCRHVIFLVIVVVGTVLGTVTAMLRLLTSLKFDFKILQYLHHATAVIVDKAGMFPVQEVKR